MAKQTFTVGQVLTAAQLTSLQQTAMLGGVASAKTASYTLVAADAGTAISMTSTSATTITVNTGLFAAGDTVQITNLGVGVCTITAGTATVNSSASLALAQYESGTLDFTSTSAAIFIKGAGAAASAGGANWTLLNSGGTATTGATTITVSGISNKDKIMVFLTGVSADANAQIQMRFNADSGSNYNMYGLHYTWAAAYDQSNGGTSNFTSTEIYLGNLGTSGGDTFGGFLLMSGCNASGVKIWNAANGGTSSAGKGHRITGGWYNSASTISSVSLISNSGNFDAGTIFVYTSA